MGPGNHIPLLVMENLLEALEPMMIMLNDEFFMVVVPN